MVFSLGIPLKLGLGFGKGNFSIPPLTPTPLRKKIKYIPIKSLTSMGVLAPGSVHARPSAQPPIDTSGNFPAHLSAESPPNISPNC